MIPPQRNIILINVCNKFCRLLEEHLELGFLSKKDVTSCSEVIIADNLLLEKQSR